MHRAFVATLLGSSGADPAARRQKRDMNSSGPSGLIEVTATYNPRFNRQKYFEGYGCHCRNMLDETHLDFKFSGAPLDRIDKACKTYTDCLRCAKEQHGTDCENKHFNWSKAGDEPVSSVDKHNNGRMFWRDIASHDSLPTSSRMICDQRNFWQ